MSPRDIEPRFKARAPKPPPKVISQRRAFSRAVKAKARTWCEVCPALVASLGDEAPRPDPLHHGAHAHHLLTPRRGGTHDSANGVWCCLVAHDWIHAHPHQAEALGFLHPSGPLS